METLQEAAYFVLSLQPMAIDSSMYVCQLGRKGLLQTSVACVPNSHISAIWTSLFDRCERILGDP